MHIDQSHLTYCLNIHPGETWDDNFAAIQEHSTAVKARLCPDKPFGLGLRLSAQAAGELLMRTDELVDYLQGAGMYAFTVNAFPYGQFHGTRVKENVYQPDWAHTERLEYTKCVALIMARLGKAQGLDHVSISTSPLGYGKMLPPHAIEHVIQAGQELAKVSDKYGVRVSLAIEPEPDCTLETSDELIAFIADLRKVDESLVNNHIGACLDTCHMALQGETAEQSLAKFVANNVLISKVQLSAALKVAQGANAKELLNPYSESTYLHQTRVFTPDGVDRYPDLAPALDAYEAQGWNGEARTHFHVPLHFEGKNGLSSTLDSLGSDFLATCKANAYHLEIETYTFDVLPDNPDNIVDSIVAEYETVLGALE